MSCYGNPGLSCLPRACSGLEAIRPQPCPWTGKPRLEDWLTGLPGQPLDLAILSAHCINCFSL